jgi:hypothetical protein
LNLFHSYEAESRKNPEADTTAPEVEIDQMVYELYGLTTEEKTLVEGV